MPQTAGDMANIEAMIRDLVADSIRTLIPVTVAIAWAWSVVTILFVPQNTTAAYFVLGISTVAGLVSHQLSARRINLSAVVYLCGVFGAVTVIAATYRTPPALLLYTVVVLLAASLIDARSLWLVTAACVAAIVVLLQPFSLADVPDIAVLITVTVLAAFAAWISARRLHTALEWALVMSTESQRNAADAQAHRGEVQRVLKNLDEAYVKLEHTNEALMLAREAADRAYRFKSDFVANVSHELRTPLNLIIGFSEMIVTAPESYNSVPLPREYRGDLMAIYRSARHLADLINDVLDLSQIEAGRMPINKEAANLGDVVREATEIIRGLIEARGLRLETNIPDDLPLLQMDRTRIRQVLLNLLTNATRFTDSGSIRIRVRIEATQAVISVEDSGRGIPPEKLKLAFEAFTQLHEDQIRDGTGLGLAVSRRFITLHGGRMWIESVEGRGTSVFFSLPVTGVKEAALADSAPLHLQGDAPQVLVLHNDPRALALLRRYVPQCAFAMADTPERASAWLQSQTPAAILMDDLWAGAQSASIANLCIPGETPVIHAALPGMRRTGALLGAIDYLAKPVTRDMLLESLARIGKVLGKVLIVDDDPHIVRLLGRIIKTESPETQILEAFGGEEALEIATAQSPDVMILDLLMPGLSGYDVLNAIAADSALAAIPVVVISARGLDEENSNLMGELRISRAKGFSTSELLGMIGAAVGNLP